MDIVSVLVGAGQNNRSSLGDGVEKKCDLSQKAQSHNLERKFMSMGSEKMERKFLTVPRKLTGLNSETFFRSCLYIYNNDKYSKTIPRSCRVVMNGLVYNDIHLIGKGGEILLTSLFALTNHFSMGWAWMVQDRCWAQCGYIRSPSFLIRARLPPPEICPKARFRIPHLLWSRCYIPAPFSNSSSPAEFLG